MPKLGAHMSIAGGYYKAIERAAEVGCEVVQVFTKNNNQWRAKPITDDDVEKFKSALKSHKLKHPVAHNSYLINMGSPDKELWKKSLDSMVVEMRRAEQLGIPYVVAHPGSFTTSSEAQGIRNIVRALNEVHKQTRGDQACCLLETTAGQGSNLGWQFEQIAKILDGVKYPDRLGVCIDTCHLFAAGYPLTTEKDYRATMREFNKTIGIAKVKAIHLNDSKAKFGSRVDRHARIGKGEMGLEPFGNLLNDSSLRRVPLYLETPKGKEKGKDLDAINLKTLRSLIDET